MKKRVFSLLLALILAVGLLPVPAWAADDAPDVTISTVEQLWSFAGRVNGGESFAGKTVALAVNLDLADEPWTPIGSKATPLDGVFDGQYHSISGLSIAKTEKDKYSYQGLFGNNAGTVQNLTVSGEVSFETSEMNAYSGGLVGHNTGTVSNCANAVTVTVTGSWSGYYVGGIAGFNGGVIENCVNRAAVTGTTAVGGIAGQQSGDEAAVRNSYNTAAVTNTGNHTGGIVGLQSGGDIANCYNAGEIGGGSNANSVVGSKRGNAPENCYYLDSTGTDGNATAKTAGELKELAETLGDAFEAAVDSYPVLVWEKDVDTSAPIGPAAPEFPETTELSARLSGYIRAAVSAKKVAADVADDDALLSTFTTSDTATDWIALAMGRYGWRDGDTYRFLIDDGYDDYLTALQADVTQKYEKNGGKLDAHKATEWQRLILAVNAMGGDPTGFGTYGGNSVDLVNDGTYNHADPGWQGINGTVFGLIALDSKLYDVPANAVTTREKFIQDILDLRLADGGWALSGTASDPDMTAMAIQALAPYYNTDDAVRAAVNAALDRLSALQTADGGFASWGSVNSESAAQVLVALCSLGIDPAEDERFIKDGKTLLDNLLTFRLPNGGFSHIKPLTYNDMATDQAAYALVAYWRLENEMRALYDMRPEWTRGERAAIDEAVTAIESLPAPGAENYKSALKAALTKFKAVDENERRYVSNYNGLALAIERVGGEAALDTGDKYPVSLTVTTPPTKTAYTEGETFEPAGMEVTLTYSDGSAETVTDYTLQPAGALTLSTTSITVAYQTFAVQIPVTVAERTPWEGAGTADSPYLIQGLDDLETLRDYTHSQEHWATVNGAHFALTCDLDFTGIAKWTPIGQGKVFSGHFDGGGHVIQNYAPSDGFSCGIFGTVDNGSVENLGVTGGPITMITNSGDVGIIVHSLQNGTVKNCWNAADIVSNGAAGYAGGVVGSVRRGGSNVIEGCYNLGSITASKASGPWGGVVGYLGNDVTVAVTNCYNKGDLTSPDDLGGVVGKSQANLTMNGCYNTGKLTSTCENPNAPAKVGDLVGAKYGTYQGQTENLVPTEPDDPKPPVTPSDPLRSHRQKALANLKKQVQKFVQADYTEEHWADLQAAYNNGVKAINEAPAAAKPYEDANIIAALNAALNAMQAVPTDKTGKITVTVSVDANTLDLGYLVKPTQVTVDRNTRASVVLTDLLEENGYDWDMTGTIDEGFYLAGISGVDQTNATVAPYIVKVIGENAINYGDRSDDLLGEFDYYNQSGWMYCVDNAFPGIGASNWLLSDGEVMRWQFTVYGYGADLNADNSSWGAASINQSLGNKDALTRLVAQRRVSYADAALETQTAYQNALDALENPTATKQELDAAYKALQAAPAPGQTSGSSTGGSVGGGAPDTQLTDAPAKKFDDVPESHWGKDAIDFAVSNHVFNGTSDTTFSPDAWMTRAMLVTVLARLDGKDTDGGESWYAKAMDWAVKQGISDGTRPEDSITRQELAAMLYRYAGSPAPEGSLTAFADSGHVAGWAKEAMAWAVRTGLIRGTSETTLSPEKTATRAEVAAILQRFLLGKEDK